MVASILRVERAVGVNQPIGALTAEADTLKGWYPYLPECRIRIMILLPVGTACTASVISRWRCASAGVVIIAASGATRPALFGAMPPVTMRPTPPRARSSKKAAMRVSL